jgi:outer membrane protein assembly factor BamB
MKTFNLSSPQALFLLLGPLSAFSAADATDWTMLGHDATRNSVSPGNNPPLDWDVGKRDRRTGKSIRPDRNIRWKADLGVGVYASPVISDGLVWIGANSQGLRNRNDQAPAALLRCYRESDGELLYEYVSPRLKGSYLDPPWHGLSCAPSIEGDQLWFFTNRCETVCLDIGPLKRGEGEPQVVWKKDLKELGIHLRPLWMWPGRVCSPSQPFDGRIYVTVPNGADATLSKVPAPEAPSLVCLDKDSGKVVWSDNSVGPNVIYSEFTSPLVANIGGRDQVVVAQGDGWVRSFDPDTGDLFWKFDINSKTS